MITTIELKIVSDESLTQRVLETFIERAQSQGLTAEELLLTLIRREIAEPKMEVGV